jgi:Cytochrome C oxidase, cbb3-type, subunit III
MPKYLSAATPTDSQYRFVRGLWPAADMRCVYVFAAGLLIFSNCQPNHYQEGERLYIKNCANCHMENGEGLGALIPPLAGADYLKVNREKLPCIIKHGLKDTIVVNGKTYVEQMPGVETLSEIHIANILNYVNNAWGNRQEPYRLDEVRDLLEKCSQQ